MKHLRDVFGVTLILLLMLYTAVHAQGWEQVYPEWEVNSLYGFLHWDGDTVYACGAEMTLLRSTNAGSTWEEQIDQTDGRYIRSSVRGGNNIFFRTEVASIEQMSEDTIPVFVFDPFTRTVQSLHLLRMRQALYPDNNIYLEYIDSTLFVLEASEDGSVLHSSKDFGKNWQSIPLPDTMMINTINDRHNLSALHFTTRDMGVIVAYSVNAQNRVMYRTTNGGSDWEAVPISLEKYDVSITTAEGATYFSSGTQVWKSLDSMKSWTRTNAIHWQSLNSPRVKSMSFVSDRIGVVLGFDYDTYLTTDGGENWLHVREYERFYGYPTSVVILPGNTILIGNELGTISRSEDGGVTWSEVRKPGITFADFFFSDQMHGVAFGSPNNRDIYSYASSDGGAHWTEQLHLTTIFNGDSVQIGTEQTVQNGADTVQFFNNGIAAMGIKRTIHRITDLGSNLVLIKEWQPGNAPRGEYSAFRNLHFIKSDEGTLYSVDDGVSWEFNSTGDGRNGRSTLSFALDDPKNLVAYCPATGFATSLPVIFISYDTCASWSSTSPIGIDTVQIDELDLLGVDEMVVRLRNGYIFHTTNRGGDWVKLSYENKTGYEYVYFADAAYQFLTPQMQLVKTSNMWDSQYPTFRHNGLNALAYSCFLDLDNIWVSHMNAIYRTTTGGVNWVQQPFTVTETAAITDIYPNPVGAGQSVAISIAPPRSPHVMGGGRNSMRVAVFDLLGREVAVLYHGPADPGTRSLTWQPSATLSAGVYMVRMTVGDKVWAKQVAVVR